MQREALGGWSMIAGAVAGLVTMAFHPTDGGQATLGLVVHALALASVPVTFYGGWVLTRRLSAGSAIAELALAFYGMSAVAALLAATASGLLAPDLIARAAAADVQRYNYALNQAAAKLFVATASVAIGLWSVEIARTGRMRRAAGILGCVVAAVTLGALLGGHVAMDVHGFGAVVLAQAIWLVVVGMELRRSVAPAA